MQITRFFLISAGLLTILSQKQSPVGPQNRDTHLVTTGQILRPAGESVSFPGRPVDLIVAPDGQRVYVKDNRGILAISVAPWKVIQELRFPTGGGSMHGIASSADGKRIYATTAQNKLHIAEVGADGQMSWKQAIDLPGPGGSGNSHACGIALSQDEKRAYVCLSINNTLGVVDFEMGKIVREIPTGIAPFDVKLSADGKTAYVSNWGGRKPAQGDLTAKSAGSDVKVDKRGVGNSGSVSVIDLDAAQETAQIDTDLHPSEMELSPDGKRLYVANANSDTISVIDLPSAKVVETLSTRPDEKLPFGSAPNALALSQDGKTLYVANGGNNAVAVITLGEKSRVAGYIPTAWYPGGVRIHKETLFVANVKGLGSRAEKPDQKGRKVYDYLGTVQKVPLPDSRALVAFTKQVREDARVPQILKTRERAVSGKKPVPVPSKVGEPSVFEHVVYIIKENRTYDQLFGDMTRGRRDPSLCIFGREVTPNHHALAEQFVLLDNYYCNGVLSADGHSWATEGNVTDHLEKAFGGFTRSYTFGDDPLTYSSSGFLWDNVLAHGLSFRNYGEMDYTEPVPANATWEQIYQDYIDKTNKITFTHNIGIDNLRRYTAPHSIGWNMRIPDVLRAEKFLEEFREYEKNGGFPNLVIIYLPNDHTSGTSPGAPTPRAQVADNDLALGRIVEAISKSRYWAKTCIFVNEDDPQDGFDHVDGHRSICLVISPYTKRGALVSQFYNQTSVLHTIQRMLGLPPMNQMDAMSPLLTDCFTAKPNFKPYTCLPNQVPLNEMNKPLNELTPAERYWAVKSLELPLERVDAAEEDLMNRILWHAVKGAETPYPAHFAGAHGKGLKQLKLRLAPDMNDD